MKEQHQQMNFLNEAEFIIVPRYAYVEYKQLQQKEKINNPLSFEETPNLKDENYLLRCDILKLMGMVERRTGWTYQYEEVSITNSFIKEATYDDFIEKVRSIKK